MTFNTEHKNVIRQTWSKKLLKFLVKQLQHKLLYLGLPSPEMEDLLEWGDYIDRVIAFQCDDDRYPDAYQRLVDNLNLLERQNKINTFNAYNGYIEQVVLQGYDNSPETQTFNLSDVVTLYNLDFCNSIDSPVEILDRSGNLKNAYKFNAVSKLLEFQKSLCTVSSKFVLFLTVHCSYKGRELTSYIETCGHESYVKEIRQLPAKLDCNARIVRLFTIDTLSTYFRTFGFIPKFFPTILYSGLSGTNLLHFTVMGIRNESAGLPPWHQTLQELMKTKFLSINDNGALENFHLESILEDNNEVIDPVEFFTRSQSFRKYWQKSQSSIA